MSAGVVVGSLERVGRAEVPGVPGPVGRGADKLVEALRTHPKVLLDRTVIDNPHYLDPAEYLRSADAPTVPQFPLAKVGAGGEDGTDSGWSSLTEAELRVVSGVAKGKTNRSIAEELYLSHHTVDAHLKHVYLKLEVHSRVALTVLALQHRLPLG